MADTLAKLVARAATLPEDRSVVLHRFEDGWSIRELALYSDLVREGELMSNCLTRTSDMRHGIWDHYNVDDEGDPLEPDDERYIELQDLEGDTIPENYRFLSLRDPENIPRLTFELMEGDLCNALGRHNSEPKWDYVERLQTWLDASPDVEITRYYDYDEGHPNPWKPTPITDWFQHHYDFAFKVGDFSYQTSETQPDLPAQLQERVAAAVDWWASVLAEDPRAVEDQIEWFRDSLTESLTAHFRREPNDEVRLTPGRPPGDHLGRALQHAKLGGLRMGLNGNQMVVSAEVCAVKDDSFDRFAPFTAISGALPKHLILAPIEKAPAPERPAGRPELTTIEV